MGDRSVIRVLLSLLVVVPFVAASGPAYGFDAPKLLVIAVLVVPATVLAATGIQELFRTASPANRAVLVTTASFVTWVVVTTALSGVPTLAGVGPNARFVGGAGSALAAALVFPVAVGLDRVRFVEAAVRGLTVALTLLSLYALVQVAGLDPAPWAVPRGGRPIATLGNSNFVGAVLCLAVPLALWLLTRGRNDRRLGTVLLAVSLTALGASQARLGWIAAAGGAVSFGVLLMAARSERAPRSSAGLVALLPVLAPGLGLLAVGVGVWIGDATGLARLNYWRAAVPMWRDNLLIGVGPGRFEAYHSAYRPAEAILEVGADRLVDSSHAWVLDLATTTGTPGAVLWLAVLVAAGLVLHHAWTAADTTGRSLLALVVGLLVSHGVQSSISVPTLVPVLLGWLLIGAVVAIGAHDLAAPQRGRGRRPPRSRAGRQRARRAEATARVVAIVAVLAVLYPVGNVWSTTRHLGVAATQRQLGAADGEIAALETAVDRTPWWPEPWAALIRAALGAGDEPRAPAWLDSAEGVDDRDRDLLQVRLFATIELDGAEAARPLIEQLRVLDPLGVEAHINVASWALTVADLDLAEEALDVVGRTVTPDLHYWDAYVALREELEGRTDS